MVIVTVLRSSGEYTPERVQWLHSQLPVDIRKVCLADCEIEGVEVVPLKYGWPGWWAKMELFDPYSKIASEDLLYFDLDTVIVGDLSPFFKQRNFTALSDFYVGDIGTLQMTSGIMYIPAEVKAYVWEKWISGPEAHMAECVTPEKWGDQGFIGSILEAKRWQDELPGMVVSYKQHVRKAKSKHHPFLRYLRSLSRKIRNKPYKKQPESGTGELPKNARIVCFHGEPRPWEVEADWIPKLKS